MGSPLQAHMPKIKKGYDLIKLGRSVMPIKSPDYTGHATYANASGTVVIGHVWKNSTLTGWIVFISDGEEWVSKTYRFVAEAKWVGRYFIATGIIHDSMYEEKIVKLVPPAYDNRTLNEGIESAK